MWKFEVWRWLLFIAGTIPLYGVSKLVVHALVVGFESYPPARGAIYYVIGIKVCFVCCQGHWLSTWLFGSACNMGACC